MSIGVSTGVSAAFVRVTCRRSLDPGERYWYPKQMTQQTVIVSLSSASVRRGQLARNPVALLNSSGTATTVSLQVIGYVVTG